MSLANTLLPHLRAVTDSKYARATLTAQAMAYCVGLSVDEAFEDIHQRTVGELRELISDINEVLYVDTRLTQNLYRALLKHRYDMLTSAVEPTLVMYALQSQGQQDLLTTDQTKELQALTNSHAYQDNVLKMVDLLSVSHTEDQ